MRYPIWAGLAFVFLPVAGMGPWLATLPATSADRGAFRLTRAFAATVLGNRLAIWSHDRFGIPLAPGLDEVPLVLVAMQLEYASVAGFAVEEETGRGGA